MNVNAGPATASNVPPTVIDLDPTDEDGSVQDDGSDEEEESDEGDPDSSSDEEDEETVSEPSNDIQGDLDDALDIGTAFEGSFYHTKSYPSAPNPCISIENFGTLGLPLSPPEAKRLISVCAQAPFGKNERTIVDKTVRDTWELDPSKILFKNSEWTKWINETVVPAVREGLGVISKDVVAQVYKMLIYETGSHFLSHQDTEKVPGMFASLIIALPSAYEGASLHLSHAGETKIIDVAASSETATSVFAWYSDVFHSVQPVTSGYRLALSYNLVCPPSPTAVRPTLPEAAANVARLKHVLLSWRQNASGDAPTKIVYNLEHQYTISNLSTGTLKGKDAEMTSFLRPIAEALDFRVYLANLELCQYGPAEHYGGGRGGWYGGYDSYDEDDDDHGGMEEIEETTLTVNNVFDLDGNAVKLDGIQVEENEEMIPYLLSEQEMDKEEYEGYQGNYGGTLEYWYRRTAFIIYPKKNETAVCNRTPFEYSIQRLREKIARGWMDKDLRSKHIETVLDGCAKGPWNDRTKDAMMLLCQCAEQGDDLDLWIRAVRASSVVQHIDRLGVPGLLNGVGLFGLEELRSLFEEAMQHMKENKQRYSLGKTLVEECQKPELTTHRDWAAAQKRYAREHLLQLTNADVPLLLEIGQTEGMRAFLDVIVPQIEQLKPPTTMVSDLVRGIRRDYRAWPAQDDGLFQQIIDKLTASLLGRVAPLRSQQFAANLAQVMDMLALCEEFSCVHLLAPVTQRLAQSFRALAPAEIPLACSQFLLPFFRRLEAARTRSESVRAASAVFSPLYGLMGSVLQFGLTANDMPDIMLALTRVGGIKIVQTMLTPHIAALAKSRHSILKTFALELYKARNTLGVKTTEERAALRTIVQQLVAAIVPYSSLELISMGYPYYGHASTSPAVEMIKFCLSFGDEGVALCGLVVNRIQPPAQAELSSWISSRFTPFITRLRDSLKEHGLSITMEPFASLLSRCVRSYVTSIGPKPQERPMDSRLSSFGCGCAHCRVMKTFILGGEQVHSFAEVQRNRTHLEQQLAKARASEAGLSWVTLRSGSPHQLKVTKPVHMVAPGRWRDKVKIADAALRALGDGQTQRLVLGDRCDATFTALGLKAPHALPAAANPAPSAGGSSAPAAGRAAAVSTTSASNMSSSKRRMLLTEFASRPAKKAKADDGAAVPK